MALKRGKDTSTIVCDLIYLRLQKQWRKRVAKEAGRLVEQVETKAVVPVELTPTSGSTPRVL